MAKLTGSPPKFHHAPQLNCSIVRSAEGKLLVRWAQRGGLYPQSAEGCALYKAGLQINFV